MPSTVTVLKWLRDFPEFLSQYARARELQADAIFDECLDIADDARNGFMTKLSGDKVVDNEAVQRSRLRIDTRKWIAGKLNSRKYGDRLDHTHTGSGGGPIEVADVTNLELARRIAFIFRETAREEKAGLIEGAGDGVCGEARQRLTAMHATSTIGASTCRIGAGSHWHG